MMAISTLALFRHLCAVCGFVQVWKIAGAWDSYVIVELNNCIIKLFLDT